MESVLQLGIKGLLLSALFLLKPQLQTAARVSLYSRVSHDFSLSTIKQKVRQRWEFTHSDSFHWLCLCPLFDKACRQCFNVVYNAPYRWKRCFLWHCSSLWDSLAPQQGHWGLHVLQVSLQGSSFARAIAAEVPRLELPRGKPCLFGRRLRPYKINFLINPRDSNVPEMQQWINCLSLLSFSTCHVQQVAFATSAALPHTCVLFAKSFTWQTMIIRYILSHDNLSLPLSLKLRLHASFSQSKSSEISAKYNCDL